MVRGEQLEELKDLFPSLLVCGAIKSARNAEKQTPTQETN